MRKRGLVAFAALVAAAASIGNAAAAVPRFSVGYSTEHALSAALARSHGTLVRRMPALRVAEVRSLGSPLRFAARLACLPGIRYVEPLAARAPSPSPDCRPRQGAACRSNGPTRRRTKTRCRCGQARGKRVHDRSDRHGRRPHRSRPRGEVPGRIQHPLGYGGCQRRERARHVRRLDRGRLGDERRGDRRVRRGREAAGRQGVLGRRLQRRGRGERDRLRSRSRRPDHQPQSRRPPLFYDRAERRRLRREARRAPRRGRRQRRAERQSGRVSGRTPAAGRLGRGGRQRRGRRRVGRRRRPCSLLELRLVPLACRARRERARRDFVDRSVRSVPGRRRAGIDRRALRLRHRYVVLGATGRGSGGPGLGGESLLSARGVATIFKQTASGSASWTPGSGTGSSTPPPPLHAPPARRLSRPRGCAPRSRAPDLARACRFDVPRARHRERWPEPRRRRHDDRQDRHHPGGNGTHTYVFTVAGVGPGGSRSPTRLRITVARQ